MRAKPIVIVKFSRSDNNRQRGFTLLELMTVVVIVGVLSAMAIPTMSDYVYKARTLEAREFLGRINLREEAYYAEFGAYCPTVRADPTAFASLDNLSNLTPDPSTTGRESTFFTSTAEWRQLGASPNGPVRFGYGVIAGDASNMPANLGLETRPGFWFIARAVGDLDGDGTYVMFEGYSADKGTNVFVGNFPSGTGPNAKGWE